jgi:uroporphyrinogen decarboxylase
MLLSLQISAQPMVNYEQSRGWLAGGRALNSLERIQSAVAFEKPDRAPVIAQVFGHAAAFSGVALGDYLRDGELLAKCQLKALEHYGYDAVFALMDASLETEAAGSKIEYLSDIYPHVKTHAVSPSTDLKNLSVPDPKRDGRMPQMLKAASMMRNELRDEVLIVGCVLGPASLTNQLYGLEPALFLSVDDPEVYTALLDYATEIAISFGKAQIEAGVHLPLLFDPAASPSVVPARFYRELILPRHRKIFSALKAAGSAHNWIHIAGCAAAILGFYPEVGVDIANFDFCVTPDEAQLRLPRTCLDGNVKPLLFVDGRPEDVAAESAALLDSFRDRGGFILSSGCEIPPDAKPENVKAMVEAALR